MTLRLKAYETSPFAIQLVGEGFNPEVQVYNSVPTMEFIMVDDEFDDKGIDWDEILAVAKVNSNAAIEQIKKTLGTKLGNFDINYRTKCELKVEMDEASNAKDSIRASSISQTCFDDNMIYREDGQPYDEKYAVNYIENFFHPGPQYLRNPSFIIELCEATNKLSYDLVKAMLESSSKHYCTFSNYYIQ